MGLSVSSFFSRYINHPLSKELSKRDKIKASVASVAIGIFTLGMAQLYCAVKIHRDVSHIRKEHKALTLTSFFSRYITHPLSAELSGKDKLKALISSVALGIITLGIVQLVCALREHKKVAPSIPVPSISVPSKGGGVPQVASASVKRFGANAQPGHVPSYNELICPFNYASAGKGDSPPFLKEQVGFNNVGELLQQYVINPYYAQPLPPPAKAKVSLPEEGEPQTPTITTDQKTDVASQKTSPHDRVLKTEEDKDHVDSLVTPAGQEPYLSTDPREQYGSDHGSRMAIFSPIFAYLYAKYDPHLEGLSKEDVLIAQFVSAGCDCGRLRQGTEVYDVDSAHKTVEALQRLGCSDEAMREQAKAAIEEKDSLPGVSKPFIAKLVQNAGHVESSRFSLTESEQSEKEFRRGEKGLDIYKELQEMASRRDGKLKGDLTWTDFQEELKSVLREMNRLIFETHNKEFRSSAALPGKHYYDEILAKITPEKYPHISVILQHLGVITLPSTIQEKIDAQKMQHELLYFKSWMKLGVARVPTAVLEAFEDLLKSIPKGESDLRSQVSSELKARQQAEEEFAKLLEGEKEKNVGKVALAFGALPYMLKRQYRPVFSEYLPFFHNLDEKDPAYFILQTEFLYENLTLFMEKSSEGDLLKRAKDLVGKVEALVASNNAIDLKFRDPCVQTLMAAALEQAASLFIDLGKGKAARGVFERAASLLDVSSPQGIASIWKKEGDMFNENEVCFLPSDCNRVRKRSLRLCEKVIDTVPSTEISFELTTESRVCLEKTLKLLEESKRQTVPAVYPRKVSGRNAYSTKDRPMIIGNDLKISIADGVDIYVGADKSLWTQYHLMRVVVKKGIDLQVVHKALSKIGLPTVLMNSRPQDERNESLARIISFRFPLLLLPGEASQDVQKVYESLSPSDRELVDKDLQATEEQYIGPNCISLVQPDLAKEAWEKGARALATFVDAGSMEEVGGVLCSILKNGFLSSEERFARGILGLGCAPYYNYETGSGGEVFTRILTKDQFENRYSLDNFALIGKIFFILDPSAFGRRPYSYLHDRGGLRNPNFNMTEFTPEKQDVIKDYRGKERVKERPGFPNIISDQVLNPHPLNETMFDLTLGPQYIQRIVVPSAADRETIVQVLKKNDIFEINGLPVEYAVVATNCLHPGMVKGFYENSYPSSESPKVKVSI